MRRLNIPLSDGDVRALRVGDSVLISGTIVTARDAAHKYMVEQKPDFIRKYLKNSIIYHCGPVVAENNNGEYEFISSGPTTSAREEPYEASVIEEYGIRGCIGKGGMGPKTGAALEKFGAVYFHAIGGAGTLAAQRVKKVENVFMLKEFGSPEAFWIITVEDFPVVVTMDAHGNSLHADVLAASTVEYKRLTGVRS